jgi:transposase
MTRPQRRYSDEFRREAVKLFLSVREFRTLTDVADELGIHSNNLRRWVRELGPEGEASSMTEAERAELNRLRKENRILKEEVEILKKADAFFATHSRR